MRYGTTATHPLEWMALKMGKVPLPILDVLLGPLQARALVSAWRAGILDRLADGAASTAAVANACSTDTECTRLLLRVVRAMGYVELAGEQWSLSPAGARYFGKGAVEPYSAFLSYGPPQWRFIEQLDSVLQTGAGIDFHDHQTPEEWEAYQRAMLENAGAFGWFVAENLPVPAGASRCLDIAGAHGLIGAELCRRNPSLRSTVLDRKEALATARELAAQRGHDDVVSFREGDLLHDPLGNGDVDVALLCNILHHFPASRNIEILGRVRRALRPGGTVGIFDIETPDDTARADAAGDALALYFRITSSSSCFRGDDYVRWLREAGFATAKVVRSVKMPSRMLVVGISPA